MYHSATATISTNFYLFFGWVLIAQMQYQNMDKDCEEIPPVR